ncbi:MAG TPA: MerR family DNA-binding protein [Tessaracoccus flavescens]|uniref:MerR family DNA-binding protein n=1 Tax=Tessaracoccus flavescens TaxID=399497 RepID=A0A921JRQ0_9ACTN|nr:MerR family DNA-binding protein [Tessaracoccus flavescens]
MRQVLQIRDADVAPCQRVGDLLDDRLTDVDRRIAALQALRESITTLRAQASRADEAACPPSRPAASSSRLGRIVSVCCMVTIC